MSIELSVPLDNWDGLQRCVRALGACQEDSERFFGRMLDDFDDLAGRLLAREEEWALRRKSADEELALRRQRWEVELNRAAERSAAVANDVAASGSGREFDPDALWAALAPRFERLLDESQRDRGTLEKLCASAESQVQNLAAALTEWKEVRGTAPPTAEAADSPDDDAAQRLREQLEAAQAEREALEDERAMMENELELLRARAAELAEQLASQRRDGADQQRQWSDELRAMRGVLQGLSQQVAQAVEKGASTPIAAAPAGTPVTGTTPSAAVGESASSPPAGGADPVLDSVMAQFEMLQKDLARRRSSRA